MEYATRQCARALAQKLVEDGIVVFKQDRDPVRNHIVLRGTLTVGVPWSKKPTITGRTVSAIPDWAIEAARAGVFSPKATAVIQRLTTQTFPAATGANAIVSKHLNGGG